MIDWGYVETLSMQRIGEVEDLGKVLGGYMGNAIQGSWSKVQKWSRRKRQTGNSLVV